MAACRGIRRSSSSSNAHIHIGVAFDNLGGTDSAPRVNTAPGGQAARPSLSLSLTAAFSAQQPSSHLTQRSNRLAAEHGLDPAE
jgi:hypothetical protein